LPVLLQFQPPQAIDDFFQYLAVGTDQVGDEADQANLKPDDEQDRGTDRRAQQELIDVGDAYVVLQGGTGTLLELAAVWEFSNKGLMDHKPIFCHSELWKEITFIMNRQMAYESRSTELVKAYDSVEEIVTLIKKLI